MADLTAKEIMTKKVITIKKNASIKELSELLVNNKISGVPVLDENGSLAGIVSEGDIIVQDSDLHFPRYFKLLDAIIYLESLNKFKRSLQKHLATKVEDIMPIKVRTVRQDTPVREVANIMIRNNVTRRAVL